MDSLKCVEYVDEKRTISAYYHEKLRSGTRVGIAAEIIPKGVINLGQSLSRPPGDSSLYTREPLGTGTRIAASLRSSQ